MQKQHRFPIQTTTKISQKIPAAATGAIFPLRYGIMHSLQLIGRILMKARGKTPLT